MNVKDFTYYTYVKDYPETLQGVLRAEPHLRAIGRPNAADMLVRAYGDLRDDLRVLARDMGAFGTAELRKIEKQTRVRPQHIAPAKSLGGALFTRVVGPAMPGAIGVADMDELNAEVPWWITNEVGSTKREGGTPLFGYFYGGAADAPPDSTQFREHSLFAVGSQGDPISGMGIISNPIPARRFIKKSIPLIQAEYEARYVPIKVRFRSRLEIVAKTMD